MLSRVGTLFSRNRSLFHRFFACLSLHVCINYAIVVMSRLVIRMTRLFYQSFSTHLPRLRIHATVLLISCGFLFLFLCNYLFLAINIKIHCGISKFFLWLKTFDAHRAFNNHWFNGNTIGFHLLLICFHLALSLESNKLPCRIRRKFFISNIFRLFRRL